MPTWKPCRPCETQPRHAEYEQWIRAMKLYGGYLKNIMKYVYPYGMVPSGIYHKDEVKDSVNFYAVQVGIRSGAGEGFQRTARERYPSG